MIFLGLQAKQATELKMLLQLPDPKCWRHPDAPSPYQFHAYWIRIQKLILKTQEQVQDEPAGKSGWDTLASRVSDRFMLHHSKTTMYNQAETSGKPEETTHSPAHHRAFKAKTTENHFRSASLPMFKHSCLGWGWVSVNFSQNISLVFPLPKYNTNSVWVAPPSNYSFCCILKYTAQEAWADLATFPGVRGKHPGIRHCNSPASVLLIQTERLHRLKYLGEFKGAV